MSVPWLEEVAPVPMLAPARATRRSAAIAAIGTSVPAQVVPNRVIAERLGVAEEWIVRRTGIHTRHIASPGERIADHAAQAARRALENAGVSAAEVDLIVAATMTNDPPLPNLAPAVAHALGATQSGGFDIGAACTGFLSALAVGTALIESGRMECVVVIGADFMSTITDPHDRSTAAVFADGAGAALLLADETGCGVGPVVLGSDAGTGAALIKLARGGTVEMNGPEVFKAAVERLSHGTLEAATKAGLTLDEVDLFVYHQANGRILNAVAERLELPRERVVDCISHYGNTTAATLPLALAYADREGRIAAGDRVLLAAFGAGFTWGATVVTWGRP